MEVPTHPFLLSPLPPPPFPIFINYAGKNKSYCVGAAEPVSLGLTNLETPELYSGKVCVSFVRHSLQSIGRGQTPGIEEKSKFVNLIRDLIT